MRVNEKRRSTESGKSRGKADRRAKRQQETIGFEKERKIQAHEGRCDTEKRRGRGKMKRKSSRGQFFTSFLKRRRRLRASRAANRFSRGVVPHFSFPRDAESHCVLRLFQPAASSRSSVVFCEKTPRGEALGAALRCFERLCRSLVINFFFFLYRLLEFFFRYLYSR